MRRSKARNRGKDPKSIVKKSVTHVMTAGEIAAVSGVPNISRHIAHLVSSGDIVRIPTATGALYAPVGTESAVCHLTASQLRLLLGMPDSGAVRQSDLPSGLRKELKSLLVLGFVEHVGLAAWKSVQLTETGKLATAPFRDNPKFSSGGLLSAYAPITAFLIVLYDLLHPRHAGAYDVLMILGNIDLPPNNRTESAMMWLSRLGYLEKHRNGGRNHLYRATEKGKNLAASLAPEISIDNPEDVIAARDACDNRPRRVRATGAWEDIPVARVRLYRQEGNEVIPAVEFIAEAGDEAVRRDSNDYGGVETVNYRHLEHEIRHRCKTACTASEIAKSCNVPVNSVIALVARMVSNGDLFAVTEAGRPGRLYSSNKGDPSWNVINRRMLEYMAKVGSGSMPPRRMLDALVASGLVCHHENEISLTAAGAEALRRLTGDTGSASSS